MVLVRLGARGNSLGILRASPCYLGVCTLFSSLNLSIARRAVAAGDFIRSICTSIGDTIQRRASVRPSGDGASVIT